jgi:uncharacterized membrane protein YccC
VKLPTASEALFSIKCFIAAMLALWVSMRIDLPRPFWAVMTAYIVSAPFSAPTRSKASYRAIGTILGAIATTFIVPQLANAPELLSLAIALWIGACLYVSLLDRTPRSYLMMLAGYTAGLIAFPTVGEPGMIFDVALARVEEILIGITCATVVHSVVLPQSFGPVLLARLDHALRDAQHWIADALAPAGRARIARDRRKLAGDITELRVMATHLPFDTSHLRWTSNAVHALQDRLAAMVPLLSAIEDRLHALRELGALDESTQWRAVLDDITTWTGSRRDEVQPGREVALRKAIKALTPEVTQHADWRMLIEVNLAARLHSLVDVCVECQNLRRHIDAGVHDDLPKDERRVPNVPTTALHLDHGLALMSALAAVITTLACCAFWILTSWPAGAGAPMMAAILCSFFATQDDPVPFIKGFLKYTIYSLPIGALYVLVLLPSIHNFETLVLVCAPAFLAMGVYLGRPSTFGIAMPFLFGINGALALQDTNNADLVSFTNNMLAQVLGLFLAAVITGVFRTVGAGWTARRLLRAGWSELARLGSGERVPSVPEFSARMVDRIALLTPRLAHVSAQRDLMAADALVDLRIGLNMAQLQGVRHELGRSEAALWPLFEHLSQHFEARPALDPDGQRRLLASLDNALRSVCSAVDGAPRAEALAALAGIRRDMFPAEPPYQPSPILEKEIR